MDQATGDPGGLIVGFVCSNQAWVSWLLTLLMAHFGLSITSAGLKKFGIAPNSTLVKIVRLLAVDVKPPAPQIVAEANQIKAEGKA